MPRADMPIVEVLVENIRARRTRKKMTMRAVAQAAGISTAYYSMIEGGLRVPPLDTISRIAKALDTPESRLLQR